MHYLTRQGCAGMLICFTFVFGCSGYTLDNIMDLHDTLFVSSKYNRNIRGLVEQSGVVRVGANFSLVGVGEVMEKEEAFSVMGLLYLSWKDDRLVWNPGDYNGTSQLVVYQEIVWKPEVKLANPVLGVHPLGLERSQIRVLYTGQVEWLVPDMYKATCKIDVVSFPWDRQSCSLDFIVSTYRPDEVIIEADADQIGFFKFEDNESWKVVKTFVDSQTDTVSKVKFWICLERRPSFQLAVVLAPIVALSFLNVFAFFVKVNSGERISFSITLLLSITLYLSMIPDKLPSHSKGMSAIIYCLNLVLTESMFICVMSIYSLHVYYKPGVPSVLCQKIVRRLLGRRGRTCTKDGHAYNDDVTKSVTEVDACNNGHVVDSVKGVDDCSVADLGITWMDVSLLMDRTFSCIASVAILGCFVVFIVYVAVNRTECL